MENTKFRSSPPVSQPFFLPCELLMDLEEYLEKNKNSHAKKAFKSGYLNM